MTTPQQAYALNPLVDEVLRTRPQVARQATMERPTLFLSGDLPPFTASGIDPNVLLRLPWQARHAVAAAGTTEDAYHLLNLYAADPEAAEIELAWLPANQAYRSRVQDWVLDGTTDDELYEQMTASYGVPRSNPDPVRPPGGFASDAGRPRVS